MNVFRDITVIYLLNSLNFTFSFISLLEIFLILRVLELPGVGGSPPPVHVYGRSFLSEKSVLNFNLCAKFQTFE